jgi:hypothetical protein
MSGSQDHLALPRQRHRPDVSDVQVGDRISSHATRVPAGEEHPLTGAAGFLFEMGQLKDLPAPLRLAGDRGRHHAGRVNQLGQDRAQLSPG